MKYFATLISALALSSPVLAGGLIGENPQTGGTSNVIQLNRALEAFDRSIQSPATRGITTFQRFETLETGKTPALSNTANSLSRDFGVEFSNICLTASGACEVDLTTKGSSCFCGDLGSFAVGVVQ